MKKATILYIAAIAVAILSSFLIAAWQLPFWKTIAISLLAIVFSELHGRAADENTTTGVTIRITKKDIVKAIARNNHGNITKS